MAYDGTYLGNLGYAGSKGGAQYWILDTVDGDAAALATGYITDAKLRGMNKGDPVLVRFYDTLPLKTTHLGNALMSVGAINATTGVGTLTGEGESAAVIATTDGLTTGLIPSGVSVVAITSSNVDFIVSLPAPSPGKVIYGSIVATGCEIRSLGAATINAGAPPNEVALAANSWFMAVAVSATEWVVKTATKAGAWTAADTAN